MKITRNKRVLDNVEKAIIAMLESKNYSYKIMCSDEVVQSSEKLVLGNRVVQKTKDSILYGNIENNEIYLVDLEEKIYTKLDLEKFPNILPNTFSNAPTIFGSLLSKIHKGENDYWKILFTMKVSNDVCEDTECYKISIFGNEDTYISKESFLPIKNIIENTEYRYTFSIDVLEENDVNFNDIQNFVEKS